jgi:hypothetical protein
MKPVSSLIKQRTGRRKVQDTALEDAALKDAALARRCIGDAVWDCMGSAADFAQSFQTFALTDV